MKKIAIIWTIVIVVIVGGLTIYGLNFKKDRLGELSEEAMVEQTKKYLGLYPALYPPKGEEIILSDEKLKDEGYDPKLEGDCIGYIVVKATDMGYEYEPYVKCPNYTSKGYSKE